VIGCKRAIFSDTYLPALDQPNVEVVTQAIAEIRPRSILLRDGSEHSVDTIIFGTGFTSIPSAYERCAGSDGRTLAQLYRTRPQSYLGVSVAGFPNFFCTLGPFGAAGNQSAIYMIESQIAYIVDALRNARAAGARRIGPRRRRLSSRRWPVVVRRRCGSPADAEATTRRRMGSMPVSTPTGASNTGIAPAGSTPRPTR
jgi:cation diffusion facilitator CzcD-associated flavoprotein CzcO